MAKINTLIGLNDYILRQLGSPIVRVEATPEQIEDIINNTIQEYSSFALDGELTKYLQMSVSGPCVITLDPAVSTVQKVSKGGGLSFGNIGGGAGFVLDYNSLVSGGINVNDAISSTILLSAQRSMMDKYFGSDLTYQFNSNKKTIEVSEHFTGNIIVEMTLEYIPDAIDYIYDHTWIKRMSVAKTKLLQSDTTGKYDATLVGGSRVNSDRMQARAEGEIEVLRQELIDKWGGPAPISVG